MESVIQFGLWTTTLVGLVLLVGAAVGRAPRRLALGLAALAELAVLLGLVANIVILARGQQTPDLVTHVSYLLSIPFIIPLGVALTYRKVDRWGLLIIAVACLLVAVLVVRQRQTLGVVGG